MHSDGNVMDRLPPHNRDAERSLLSSMMRDNMVIPEAVNLVRGESFYVYAHQLIFEAIAKLNDDQGKAADIVTVGEYLLQNKLLDEIGGVQYLMELWDAAPSAAHFRYYAEIIRQKGIVRSLIHTCNELQADAYDQSQSPTELLDSAERKILEIAEMGLTGDTTTLEVALKEAYDRLDARKQRGENQLSGISTGYVDLDNLTAGFQNSDLVILAARPSVGKCLAWDSEIVLEDGSVATMQEVYRRQQARLLTLGEDWRFRITSPSAFVDDGMKEVYRVTTRLGRSIETTASHPFLTIHGWRPLAEISSGEAIAVPRRLDIFGREAMRECDVKLLAYFIGDGCLTDNSPEFTNTNPAIQADFEEAIQAFGVVKVRREDSNGTRAMTFCISSDLDVLARNRREFGERLRTLRTAQGRPARRIAQSLNVPAGLVCMWEKGQCAPAEPEFSSLCALLETEPEELIPGGLTAIRKNGKNALARWLDELGLWGKGAHDKFVPAIVFRLPSTQLAMFLNRLFATDGWATVSSAGAPQLGYCSVSERLIRQLQHLLLRFGVIASIRKKAVKYREQQRTAWQLDITDQQSIRIFVETIGIFGKEEAVQRVLEALEGRNYQTNCDLILRAIWERLTLARGTASWRTVACRMGLKPNGMNLHVGKRDLSRKRLREVAVAVEAEDLVELSDSEVYWDRIVSIEPVGVKQVYDLTIPDTHNFVANDICVHNTAYALNIARHVVVEEQLPVLFVSLEQARVELAERLLCCQARVDSHKLRRGHLSAEEMQKIFEAGDILSNSKLFIDDTPGQNMLRIAANARRLKKKHNLRLVMIDYLQLIDPDDRRESRQEQVSGISRRLKFLARELKVPVVALAQVNRSSEDRQDHKPRLSDLRESGAIEQDADTVLMLHRPDYHEAGQHEGLVEVIVAKQRNGPTGGSVAALREAIHALREFRRRAFQHVWRRGRLSRRTRVVKIDAPWLQSHSRIEERLCFASGSDMTRIASDRIGR